MTTLFTSDDVIGNVLFEKICVFTWMLMCALLCTGYFATCRRDMLRQLSKLIALNNDYARSVKKEAIIYTSSAWLVIIVDTLIVIYGLFFSDGIVNSMMAPCYSLIRDGNFLVWKSLFIIVNFYLNSAWVFPIAMNTMLSSLFYHQLSSFNHRFSAALSEVKEDVCNVMEMFRQEHQSISRMIKKGDSIMVFMNASLIVCQIAIFITMLYTLIFYPSRDPVIIFASVFWIVTALISLGIGCIGCIIVNHTVC